MNLLIAVITATLIALISRKINFTPIPLYILIGIILKQAGLLEFDETTEVLSKLGIAFLLFYVGLKINPSKIKGNLNRITSSGIIDFVSNFFPPFLLLTLLGYDLVESFVISSALYISSSAINIKMLIDDRKLIFPFAETVVWLMVFEDLVMILILSILSAKHPLYLLKFILIFIFIYCLYKVSWIFSRFFNRSDEVPYLVTFTIPAVSLIIAEKFGISEALLAIAMGIALSNHKIDKLVIPFKEVFLAIFFVTFGAMIEFDASQLPIILSLVVIAILGKLLGGYMISFIHKSRDGLEIFKYTLARGEFSVVIITLFAVEYAEIIAAVVLVTSILAPILIKILDKKL